MVGFFRRNFSEVFLIIAGILSAGSFVFAKVDDDFSLRWLVFWGYLFSLFFIFLAFWFSSKREKVVSFLKLDKVDLINLIFLMSFSVGCCFIGLKSFPFVSIGDELRDGGLNAMEISSEVTKNIFAYGSYSAHGLIVPTFASLFYKLFGGSVLVYRVPAAIIGFLSILLIYFLARWVAGTIAGFWATLVLATLPLHLYYSRTELVVISSSFISLVVIFMFFLFVKYRTGWNVMLLATIIGFSMNFHASVKAVALVVALVTGIIIAWDLIRNRGKDWYKIPMLVIFFVVGFGPRLLFTSLGTFFHTSRYGLREGVSVGGGWGLLGEKYIRSLLVWVSQPTTAWYPDHRPIFPVFLAYFLGLGIVVSFIKKNVYLISLVFIFLISHFTNSAITDMVNGDHRLSPLLPVGALFAGVGISWFLSLVEKRSKWWRNFMSLGMICCLIFYSFSFFWYQKPNLSRTLLDYVSMNMVYILKAEASRGLGGERELVCLVSSPVNAKNFGYMHYSEQYRFMLPSHRVEVKADEKSHDNEVYVYKGSCSEYSLEGTFRNYRVHCRGGSLRCPLGYDGEIVVKVQM